MTLLKHLASAAMVAVFVLWFVQFRPTAIGGPASYEVVAGISMKPGLEQGDLVIAEAQPTYGPGDVIVFHVPTDAGGPGPLVIHRIVGGDARAGFVVKGDNKPAPDPWHPKAADIIGRSWVRIPGGGNWLLILRRPTVLGAVAAGLAAFWFFLGGGGQSRVKRHSESAAT
jgi:signal peptidase I